MILRGKVGGGGVGWSNLSVRDGKGNVRIFYPESQSLSDPRANYPGSSSPHGLDFYHNTVCYII